LLLWKKKILIETKKIAIKQDNLSKHIKRLEVLSPNHGREATSALVKNMSQYFPIDDENKTMETLEEMLKSDKKFLHSLVSTLFIRIYLLYTFVYN